jgi:hypothetical protein
MGTLKTEKKKYKRKENEKTRAWAEFNRLAHLLLKASRPLVGFSD